MGRPYCEPCYGTGELDCHCGGDLCICENNGTYECPHCLNMDDDYDDAFDGYDAGEWNNVPEPAKKTAT